MSRDEVDLLAADPRARTELERELLQLAQQPLLALADVGDERLGGVAIQRDAEPLGLAAQPVRQLLGLQVAFECDAAPGLLAPPWRAWR